MGLMKELRNSFRGKKRPEVVRRATSVRAEPARSEHVNQPGAGGEEGRENGASAALTQLVTELRAEVTGIRETLRCLDQKVDQLLKAEAEGERRRRCKRQSARPLSVVSLQEGSEQALSEEFFDALATSLLHLQSAENMKDGLFRGKVGRTTMTVTPEESKRADGAMEPREVCKDIVQMGETSGTSSAKLASDVNDKTSVKKTLVKKTAPSPPVPAKRSAPTETSENHITKPAAPVPATRQAATNEGKDETGAKSAPPVPAKRLATSENTDPETKPAKPEPPVRQDATAGDDAVPLSKEDGKSKKGDNASTARPLDFVARRPASSSVSGPGAPAVSVPVTWCDGRCSSLGHRWAAEIERVIGEQLRRAASGDWDQVEQKGGWTLFAQEGEMRLYRLVQQGTPDDQSVEPLMAVHKVAGVTARELCRHYWEPDLRLDWEHTVDRLQMLERPDPSTVIVRQVHRRVWPAEQRDTLFWSHLCRRTIDGRQWCLAVNHSIPVAQYQQPAEVEKDGCVRAEMTSCLAACTLWEGEVRGQLVTRVTYSSTVDPGGWAPSTALRLVYKREYPRFLKRFTTYVIDKCRAEPIEW